MSETLNKKALLEWLNREIKDDNWAQFSAERALRDVRNFVESDMFDADESEGTWKATSEFAFRLNDHLEAENQRLRAALNQALEALEWIVECSTDYQSISKARNALHFIKGGD